MKNVIENIFNESINLKKSVLEKQIENILNSSNLIIESLKNGNKVLLCGNGGSAADSQHIATEFTVRLKGTNNREPVSAIALTTDTSHLTACANDYGFEYIFSRLIKALGKSGDILLAFSTSGNSQNVINAVNEAKKLNIKSIGLLGKDGGKLRDLCDESIVVPSNDSGRIQEIHILLGHIFCEAVDREIYNFK